MNPLKLIAVFVENKSGQTAAITKILADAGVNIRWVTIANSGSFGVMKFLVDKTAVAMEALQRSNMMVSLVEVLAVEVPDQPGALRKIADLLGSSQINLTYCSGYVANNRAILVIETHEIEKARAILQNEKLRLLSEDEMQQP
jgi:hypothetical protein